MAHDPHHDHDHGDHTHPDPHAPIAEDHDVRPESARLERAIRELLIGKGIFSAADLQRQIELSQAPNVERGARMVARAWTDPEYKAWLLKDPKAAIEDLLGVDLTSTPELAVVENTPERHHVVCCTLCSCYPRAIIGLPPAWYKSVEYRARVVREPRAVLEEFGTTLPPEVEIRVVDSTADMRYIVLPLRPSNTEQASEEELARLVTRDSLIGVTVLPGSRA